MIFMTIVIQRALVEGDNTADVFFYVVLIGMVHIVHQNSIIKNC